jgi:ATP-dependent RNA helicase DDX54/DBP10
MLFSATLPQKLTDFTISGISDYKLVKLDHEHRLSDDLKIDFYFMRTNDKIPALLFLLNEIIKKDETTIIFAATKYHVEFIHSILESANFKSCYVFGSLDMEARTNNLTKFRKKIVKILIVTDLAA